MCSGRIDFKYFASIFDSDGVDPISQKKGLNILQMGKTTYFNFYGQSVHFYAKKDKGDIKHIILDYFFFEIISCFHNYIEIWFNFLSFQFHVGFGLKSIGFGAC